MRKVSYCLAIATKVRQLGHRLDKMEKESVECVRGVETYIQNYLQEYDCRLIAVEGQMSDLTKLMTTQSSLDNESFKKLEKNFVDFVEENNNHLKKTICKRWVKL